MNHMHYFANHAKAGRNTLALAVAMLCTGAHGTGAAAENDLETRMTALQDELTRLRAEMASNKAATDTALATVATSAVNTASKAVTAGSAKGTFKLPDSNTSIAFGGYVKGSATYSSVKSVAGILGDNLTFPIAIPVGPDADLYGKGRVKFNAQESRFNFRSSTPTSLGEATTFLEGDFFGTPNSEAYSNGHGFRLRHAWATLGNFGVGQFWSNLMNTQAFIDTLDFAGTVGSIGNRQVGFRWTQPTSFGMWSVALENPQSMLQVGATDENKVPDLNGKLGFKTGYGYYEVAGLVRRLSIDQVGNHDSTSAGGVVLSGVIPVFKTDDIKFQYNRGSGMGRYIGGFGTFNDTVLLQGQLKNIDTQSVALAYRHFWQPNLRSTLAWSLTRADNPAGTVGTATKEGRSAHANLVWTVAQGIDLGAEFIYGYRKIESALDGDVKRLQLSGKFGF